MWFKPGILRRAFTGSISISGMICFLLIYLVSCQGIEDPAEPNLHYDYFGLKVGRFIEYRVDSSYYRQNVRYPVNYFLKVSVTDSTVNAEGGITYLLNVQKRNLETDLWRPAGTHTARIDQELGIYVDGNTSYVKLIFPPSDNLAWNGNLYNNLGGNQTCGNNLDKPCDIYTMVQVGTPFTVSSALVFENTLTVEQNNEVDAIVGDDVRKEVYAKGVGLIHREATVTEYCTVGCPAGSKFITKGLFYKQVLVAYGQN